jgi:hypothetical protein
VITRFQQTRDQVGLAIPDAQLHLALKTTWLDQEPMKALAVKKLPAGSSNVSRSSNHASTTTVTAHQLPRQASRLRRENRICSTDLLIAMSI